MKSLDYKAAVHLLSPLAAPVLPHLFPEHNPVIVDSCNGAYGSAWVESGCLVSGLRETWLETFAGCADLNTTLLLLDLQTCLQRGGDLRGYREFQW